MLPTEQDPQINRTRRHFLGLAAATSARVAAVGAAVSTMVPPSAANALGRLLDKKPPKGGTMCFLRGTAITTPTGETCIEDLQIGDLVQTASGDAMPVKWIGRQTYKQGSPSWHASVMPIRIARHALDEQTPHRDLYVSPGHALFIDGVLIRAEDLVNGISIAPALPAGHDAIDYFHIILERHEVVLAEGAAAETFLVQAGNHEDFANFAEFARLNPDVHAAMVPVAPIVGYSGRTHLKALLRLAAGRFDPNREPVDRAFDRIAARARQRVG